jgi:hypothetical protein
LHPDRSALPARGETGWGIERFQPIRTLKKAGDHGVRMLIGATEYLQCPRLLSEGFYVAVLR